MCRVALLAGLTLVIATTAGTALATDAPKPVLHENQDASAERLARTTPAN